MSTISKPGCGEGESLESMMRDAREGFFVLDRHRQFIAYSDGCARITGYTKSAIEGQACRCHDTLNCHDEHGRSLAGALCPGFEVFHGEAPSRVQVMRIRRADGNQVWVETTYSRMHNDQGETIGVIGVMRPAAEPGDLQSRTSAVLLPPTKTVPLGVDPRAVGADADGSATVLDGVLLDVERQQIISALRRASGQRAKAARALGISRSRLYRRMDALGIDPRSVF